MMRDKLAKLMLVVVITCNLFLTTQCESHKIVLSGDPGGSTVAASEDHIFDLKCTDTNFTEEHYIIWYRYRPNDKDKTEIYRNGSLLTSDLGQEALAYSLNNSTEYELTISITRGLDVGKWIHGNGYRCKVIDETTGVTLFESTRYSFLNVQYPPPSQYPICVASGYQNDSIGQNVTLSCYTESGNPRFTIEWWRDDIMIAIRSVEFQNNMRFALTYLYHTLNLQQQDLEATYQCRVKWFNDVAECTVQSTSSQPSTLIPTTKYQTTVPLTTKGKTTSFETVTYTRKETMPQETLTTANKSTSSLVSDKTMLTITSPAILPTDFTTKGNPSSLRTMTQTKIETSTHETLSTTSKSTTLQFNIPSSLDSKSTMLTIAYPGILTTDLTSKEMSGTEFLKSKNNPLYYIIAGSAVGCVALLIMIIWCNVRKKTSGGLRPLNEYHEMQTGKGNNEDCQPDEESNGIGNPVYDEQCQPDQTEILHSQENASSLTDTVQATGSEKNIHIYTQVLPKPVKNAKLQQAKEDNETENKIPTYSQVLPKPVKNAKFQPAKEGNGTENKVPTYTQVLPMSARNAKLQSAKQADSIADMDIHIMVDNNIYAGLVDPTTSMSANACSNNEMVDKTAPKETKSTLKQGNEGSVREENTGLRDSHVMEENNEYVGFMDPPIPATSKQDMLGKKMKANEESRDEEYDDTTKRINQAGDNGLRDSHVMEENALYAEY